MADSTDPDLLTTLMGDGLHSNGWGDIANANQQRIIDKLVKRTALSVTGGTVTLTSTQELVALLDVSGALVSGSIIEFSGRKGVWIVKNGTSGAFSLTTRVTGQTGITVAQGTVAIIYCDGTDIRSASAGLADPGANGLVARTASGTTAARTLTGPAAGITVTNGDGVSGNPTLALANDLAALEALAGTGIVARTASETYAQRSVAAGTGISVSNGDGVSGNPTVTIAAPTARLDTAGQAVTGGGIVTSNGLGTISSGTVTLSMGDRPLQDYTNNGAHTLAPGTNRGACLVDITNGASAGAITTSGWTKVSGSFDTTNAHVFRCHCSVGAGGSLLVIQAMQ